VDVVQLGCGVCGLVCAEHLARHPKVDRLILADRRTKAAEDLASRLPGGNAVVEAVDGTDPAALEALLKTCDIVIASMPWRLNRLVLEAAAKVGTDYVDFGMPFDGTGPEFDAAARVCTEAGIAALVGMGMEPGISDVFAIHAASRLDRADEAHVFDGDTASVEGLDLFSVWSPVDLLDEMSVPAAVLEGGRITFVPPLSDKQTYVFPDPVGPLTVYKTNHDETYFLPMGLPTLRRASFNIFIDPAWIEAAAVLRKLGLLTGEPIDVRGVRIRPLDVLAAALPSPVDLLGRIRGHATCVVEVTGPKRGTWTKVRMWAGASYADTYRHHGTNATAYMVGTGGAVATEMLLEGEVEAKGLVIPEHLAAANYLRRLRDKGVEVHEETIDLGVLD
jgi:saccharopine dehydrogenase-like NADP-dependent oxidoreductase